MINKLEIQRYKSMLCLTLLIGLSLFATVACSDAGAGDPADTVERYMQAKVDADRAVIQGLLCSEMESFLDRESMTFESVTGTRLEGVSCQQVGDTESVKCNGEIIALYGTEETSFPLTTYRVVQEDGEWKWCGESN